MLRTFHFIILSLFALQLSTSAETAPIDAKKIGMQFPIHTFSNLAKQKKKIPDELDGDYKLMIVAFQRNHQQLVDTWFAAGDALELSYSKPGRRFRYYEIPTIYEMGFIRRSLLNTGMRSGVKAQAARERTFTIYIDKAPFNKTLQIPDETDIHLFLLNSTGKVVWRCQGKHSAESEKSLTHFLKKQMR
jgi:hypothetical protein